MMKTKLTTMIAALAVTLTLLTMPSNATPDNTFRFSGPFGLQNPCNFEVIEGPIDINIVVTTTVTGNGDVQVNIHHTSHGTLTGPSGDTYQISRHAKETFDAIAADYDIPWTGNFVGTGSAPDFTVDGTLRVFVNTQNEPIASGGLLPLVRTCKKP